MVLRFFRCVAKAAVKNGVKRLAELVGIDALYEFGKDVYEEYREEKRTDDIRHDVELVAALSPDEARQQALSVVNAIAPQLSAEDRQTLTGYLALIPPVMRQSLRHKEDPTGKTISPARHFNSPADLLDLLPRRAPRFQAGERPDVIGGWVLAELLGVGGFGEVWKAHHPTYPATMAAFKFCHDETAQQRLLGHEGKVLNQVMGQSKHPGVVALQDANLNVKPAWLKFEYVEGGDLANLVASWRSLTDAQRVTEATDTILQLADIVGHFHRLTPAVIHRDLKPANILVQTAHGQRRLRIADFGIGMVAPHLTPGTAQVSTPNATFGATFGGAYTPGYASLQQEKRLHPDVRDDVFALGVIWHQLLLGDLTKFKLDPFWIDTLKALGVSEPAIRLLGRCISEESKNRPDDAQHFADQLRQLNVHGQQVIPRRKKSLAEELEELRAEAQLRWSQAEEMAGQHEYGQAVALLANVPKEFLNAAKLKAWQALADEIAELQPVLHASARDFLADHELVKKARRLVEIQPHHTDLKHSLDKLKLVIPRKAGDRLEAPAGITLVTIPHGTFMMGSPTNETDRQPNETQHRVTLTKDFAVGVTPVTQAQWQAVMGNNPSYFKGDQLPVESVTWFDAVKFCNALSAKDNRQPYYLIKVNKKVTKTWFGLGADQVEEQTEYQILGGNGYRLPTEAEWEYACRAGSTTAYCFGNDVGKLSEYAWFSVNSSNQTHPVGQKKANAWGLHDMHGNVWEWCWDRYGEYPAKDISDPQGLPT